MKKAAKKEKGGETMKEAVNKETKMVTRTTTKVVKRRYVKQVSVQKTVEVEGKKLRCYASGQNQVESGLCIATFLDGTPCNEPVFHEFVPYCALHMEHGDPSLQVTRHPNRKLGKMLIAKRDLPARYYMGLFG